MPPDTEAFLGYVVSVAKRPAAAAPVPHHWLPKLPHYDYLLKAVEIETAVDFVDLRPPNYFHLA